MRRSLVRKAAHLAPCTVCAQASALWKIRQLAKLTWRCVCSQQPYIRALEYEGAPLLLLLVGLANDPVPTLT